MSTAEVNNNEKLSLQECFDKVWKHFVIDENPQSIRLSDYRCYYRSPSGIKCAIGCLIPDEMYNEDMEKTQLLNFQNKWPGLPFHYLDHVIVRDLQRCHDHAVLMNNFTMEVTNNLKDFAIKYNLTVP